MDIKWYLTPHASFLPLELGAWVIPPIHVHRLSPSPDPEEEFTAREDFPDLVHDFVQNIGNAWRPPAEDPQEDARPPQGSPSPIEVDQQQTTTNHEADPTPILTASPGEREPDEPGTSNMPDCARPNPTSRPKKKCTRKKHKQKQSRQQYPGPLGEIRNTYNAIGSHTGQQSNNGKENLPTDRQKPISRPKQRCTFGPRHGHLTSRTFIQQGDSLLGMDSTSLTATREERPDNSDIETLLNKIHLCRNQDTLPPLLWEEEITHESRVAEQGIDASRLPDSGSTPPKDRSKAKCIPEQPENRIKTPRQDGFATPLASTSHHSAAGTSTHLESPPRDTSFQGDRIERTVLGHASPLAAPQTLPRPDRVTLTLPSSPRRSPFVNYKTPPVQEQGLNPYRFVIQRLGLTEASFEARITQEVNENLTALANARRQALRCAEESTVTTPPGPPHEGGLPAILP